MRFPRAHLSRCSVLRRITRAALGVALAGCDPGSGGRGGGAAPVDGHTLGTLGDTRAVDQGVDATASDAAGPSASCIQGADLDAIQLHILATSGVCGVLCAHDRAPSTCAAICVESRNAHIGPTCSHCFGDLALCAANHCLAVCAAAPSAACVSCGAANCAAEFERCYDAASLVPTACDGPTYCAPGETRDPTAPDAANDSRRPDDPTYDADDAGDSGPEEACPSVPIYYRDVDGDGFGDTDSSSSGRDRGPDRTADRSGARRVLTIREQPER